MIFIAEPVFVWWWNQALASVDFAASVALASHLVLGQWFIRLREREAGRVRVRIGQPPSAPTER